MTSTYDMVDKIITEQFGDPDPALGGFLLDHGNLQAFAVRVLVEYKRKDIPGASEFSSMKFYLE